MRNKFIFGDLSTDDFSMKIERFPTQIGPVRKRQDISVLGRNGTLHYQENAFENYIQPYKCYFHGKHPTPQQAHAIKAWLMHSGAYQRLQDTYDPEHYRMATFVGPLDVENILNKYGRCVINFDCAPQSFLVSGDTPIRYKMSGSVIHNPTLFPAKPLIRVYGARAGTVTVGNATVRILDLVDPLILDCDLQDAYRQGVDGVPENHNANISAPVFPELLPGDNPVSFTGGVAYIEIVPRWWEL